MNRKSWGEWKTSTPRESFNGSPKNTDVLLGRGKSIEMHPGNVFFRCLIEEWAPIYHQTERGSKRVLVKETIDAVSSTGARFMRRNGEGLWEEATQEVLMTKVAHAYRHRTRTLKQSPKLDSRSSSSLKDSSRKNKLKSPPKSCPIQCFPPLVSSIAPPSPSAGKQRVARIDGSPPSNSVAPDEGSLTAKIWNQNRSRNPIHSSIAVDFQHEQCSNNYNTMKCMQHKDLHLSSLKETKKPTLLGCSHPPPSSTASSQNQLMKAERKDFQIMVFSDDNAPFDRSLKRIEPQNLHDHSRSRLQIPEQNTFNIEPLQPKQSQQPQQVCHHICQQPCNQNSNDAHEYVISNNSTTTNNNNNQKQEKTFDFSKTMLRRLSLTSIDHQNLEHQPADLFRRFSPTASDGGCSGHYHHQTCQQPLNASCVDETTSRMHRAGTNEYGSSGHSDCVAFNINNGLFVTMLREERIQPLPFHNSNNNNNACSSITLGGSTTSSSACRPSSNQYDDLFDDDVSTESDGPQLVSDYDILRAIGEHPPENLKHGWV